MHDPRYDFVTCATCGKRWQNIDFGSVGHVYFCSKPERPHDSYALERHDPNAAFEAFCEAEQAEWNNR